MRDPRDDDVGTERYFKATAATNTVDRTDDRLVEILQLLDATKSADTVVTVDFLATGRGLEIPARRKEFLAAASDDCDAQVRIVAVVREYFAEPDTGRTIDRIGFWPVDHDFQYAALNPYFYVFCTHDVLPIKFPGAATIHG